MSLVQKIPPMVSALAFGYGVGMAAPDSTLSSMKTAVSVRREAPAAPATPALARVAPAARITAGGIGGDESRELGRLREVATREARRSAGADGAACELDR